LPGEWVLGGNAFFGYGFFLLEKYLKILARRLRGLEKGIAALA